MTDDVDIGVRRRLERRGRTQRAPGPDTESAGARRRERHRERRAATQKAPAPLICFAQHTMFLSAEARVNRYLSVRCFLFLSKHQRRQGQNIIVAFLFVFLVCPVLDFYLKIIVRSFCQHRTCVHWKRETCPPLLIFFYKGDVQQCLLHTRFDTWNAICYHFIAMSGFRVSFLWSPVGVAEWPARMADLPERVGKRIYEMIINHEYPKDPFRQIRQTVNI